MLTMKKTSFELLPEDLQRHISGYLNFVEVLNLQEVASNLKHVKRHMFHIISVYDDNLCVTKMCELIDTKLKTLELYNRSVTTEQLCVVAQHLPSTLVKLKLSVCNIGTEGIKQLALYLPDYLQELILYNSFSEDIVTHLVPHLPKYLKLLDLSYNKIAPSRMRLLARYMPKSLKVLRLSGCQITHEGVEYLASHLPQTLEVLELGSNGLGNESVKYLVPHLPKSLVNLSLRDNRTGAIGLQNLQSYLPNLLKLDINDNSITDVTVKNLKSCFPESLQILDLTCNNITMCGIKDLLPLLPKSLRELHLKNSRNGTYNLSHDVVTDHFAANGRPDIQTVLLEWWEV